MKRLWLVIVVALAIGALAPATALATTPWLISPANGTTVPRNAENGWYPYLQWGNSNPDLTTYMFQIASSPAALSDGSFVSDNVVLANYGILTKSYNYGTTYPYMYLLPGTYYWHVLDMFPSGGTGFSAWSPTWSFTVPPPAAGSYSMQLTPVALTWEIVGEAPANNDPYYPKRVVFDCYGPAGAFYTWQSGLPTVPWLTETQIDNKTCEYMVNANGMAPGTYRTSIPVTMTLDVAGNPHVVGSPYNLPVTMVIKARPGSTYMITPSAGSNGSITPSTPQIMGPSTSRTFEMVPASRYHVAQVRVDDVSVGAPSSYTFSNVSASHTIAVSFAANTLTLGTPVAPKKMSRSKPYTVYGLLRPRHAAGTKPVKVYKYRKVSGRWRDDGYVWARAYDHGSDSRYKASVKLTRKGSYRLRAYAPADAGHFSTWSSKFDYVTVK